MKALNAEALKCRSIEFGYSFCLHCDVPMRMCNPLYLYEEAHYEQGNGAYGDFTTCIE
jgi:hypothetical protein